MDYRQIQGMFSRKDYYAANPRSTLIGLRNRERTWHMYADCTCGLQMYLFLHMRDMTENIVECDVNQQLSTQTIIDVRFWYLCHSVL